MKYLLILTLSLVVISCASTKIDPTVVDKIKVGETTSLELQNLLGEPYNTSSFTSNNPKCGDNWTVNTYYSSSLSEGKILSISVNDSTKTVCDKMFSKSRNF